MPRTSWRIKGGREHTALAIPRQDLLTRNQPIKAFLASDLSAFIKKGRLVTQPPFFVTQITKAYLSLKASVKRASTSSALADMPPAAFSLSASRISRLRLRSLW